MLWPCADIGKAEFLQKAPDTDLTEIDAKPLLDDAFKIDAAPTHHAVLHRVRTSHDYRAQLLLLRLCQLRRPPRRARVDETIGPFRVVGMHPVAQGLTIHSTDPRRSPAALPVQNRSQGQQPTRLIGILRRARTPAQIRRPKPPLHRYRCPHDRPRINCHGGTESRRLLPGNPLRSRVRNSEVWYNTKARRTTRRARPVFLVKQRDPGVPLMVVRSGAASLCCGAPRSIRLG